MLLELILVAVVAVTLGLVAVKTYNARHAASEGPNTTTASGPATQAQTVANGSVDNAVNALVQNASADSSARSTEDSDASSSSSAAATNVGGSFDENSF